MIALYFALALGITWLLDLPMILSGGKPTELAMLGAGLGAWGPTFAMLIASRAKPGLKWKTNPLWIVAGLAITPALHLVATLIEVALGGQPAHWFYPPIQPEHIAALVMFSLGEEFGWRGFAYPRLAERHGPIIGALIVGFFWTVWHLGMWLGGQMPSASALGFGVVELMAASVFMAWFFEKSNRSMWVAFALHASGHLDNVNRAPDSELRLRALRLLVYIAAAIVAGRALQTTRVTSPT